MRVDDPRIARQLCDILDLQLRDTVNARVMLPDGSYAKVKPAEGQPPVDSQMAMYGYFQHAFEQIDPPGLDRPQPKPQPPVVEEPRPALRRDRVRLRGLLESLRGLGDK